jgi:hypothetical protein
MRYYVLSYAGAFSRSMLNGVVQALTALSFREGRSRQDGGHTLFGGPVLGTLPRARDC